MEVIPFFETLFFIEILHDVQSKLNEMETGGVCVALARGRNSGAYGASTAAQGG